MVTCQPVRRTQDTDGFVRVRDGDRRRKGAALGTLPSVDLGPVARRLEAGERLRLQLSGSDHPLWDLNLSTGERWSPRRASFGGTATQVFYHDAAHPSALLLPIEPEEAP